MTGTGIRRNQNRWHTLKLSCIAKIAKPDGREVNAILASVLMLGAFFFCIDFAKSYLACVVVNTVMVTLWAELKRAHYQVVLPAALAAASLELALRLYFGSE